MNYIHNQKNCPVCASAEIDVWTSRKWQISGLVTKFSYLTCKNCGLIFCNPIPSEQELSYYYRYHFSYDWYEKRLFLKKLQAQHRWIRTRKLISAAIPVNGKMLDVGCGHGLFVKVADKKGIIAEGIDFPSQATEYATKKLKVRVIDSDLKTAIVEDKIPRNSFDFITAWHCLEHIASPQEFFQNINDILKPEGKILIAVPNSDSYGMRHIKEDWCWTQAPYLHVIHYNERNISSLIEKSGFRVLKTWSCDTWDANKHYDLRYAGKVDSWTNQYFSNRPRMKLFFQEFARIFFYFLFCHRHWLFNKKSHAMDGSELLILAEKTRSNATV
jgi:2-polyprenyl-3-methyl-5-hydroxy-6-metoxy-1,4-benzoquinol methylase